MVYRGVPHVPPSLDDKHVSGTSMKQHELAGRTPLPEILQESGTTEFYTEMSSVQASDIQELGLPGIEPGYPEEYDEDNGSPPEYGDMELPGIGEDGGEGSGGGSGGGAGGGDGGQLSAYDLFSYLNIFGEVY